MLVIALGCPAPSLAQQEESEADRRAVTEPPLVPLITNFWSYWDHYWTTWLPDHPDYEMIEVTVFDGEGRDTPLIRVFMSAREGAGEQIFYLNDRDVVERSRANARYADITYQRSGTPGAPQTLSLHFRDENGIAIDWSIDFSETAEMGPGADELTPSIHSIGGVLLFAHAAQRASTYRDSARFDGVEFAHQGPDDDALQGIRSWYNSDYHSAVAIFGVQQFRFDGESLSHSWGGTYSPEAGSGGDVWISEPRGPENVVRLTYEDGGLQAYAHYSHGRALVFDIEPSLPPLDAIIDGARHDFTAGFGEGSAHMRGALVTHRAGDVVVLEWRPDHPGWAIERPFFSLIQRENDGYYLLLTDEVSRVFAEED
tara:strand:+ start:3075 stop:4184 length:1110 start_codon:yes stop_codon:yes gene_type:complete